MQPQRPARRRFRSKVVRFTFLQGFLTGIWLALTAPALVAEIRSNERISLLLTLLTYSIWAIQCLLSIVRDYLFRRRLDARLRARFDQRRQQIRANAWHWLSVGMGGISSSLCTLWFGSDRFVTIVALLCFMSAFSLLVGVVRNIAAHGMGRGEIGKVTGIGMLVAFGVAPNGLDFRLMVLLLLGVIGVVELALGLFSLACYIRLWRRFDDARRWPLHQRFFSSLIASLGMCVLGIGLCLLGILPVFLQDFWLSLLVAASFLIPGGTLLYLAFKGGIDQAPFPQRA